MFRAMNVFLFIGLCLVQKIRAFEINGQNYKPVKGIKAHLNVTRVTKARSVVHCASQFSKEEGCARANFYNSTCEFLDFVPGTEEIELVEEQDSKYIYSESCQCHNEGICTSTESGIQCMCSNGYAGTLCQTECALVYNGKCYVAVMERLSWYDTRDNCINRGGRLAEICEPGLNDRLLQVSEDMASYFWLGGSDDQLEGQWEWATGSCNLEWTDWGSAYHSTADQNCLCFHHNLHWNDCGCGWDIDFICEL